MTKAKFDEPVVDELAAIIHIQRSQGKGKPARFRSSVSNYEGAEPRGAQ